MSSPRPPNETSASTPTAPRAVGRYEVERLLGQGGMGRVWLARDTVLGRRVAIKVLRDDLALPPSIRDELVARMRHEAQAAAAVSHPGIVTLHDMGEDPEVGLFLVFEYVPGPHADGPESLRDRLGKAPVSLGELARLARDLGAALTFAHAEGIIHRDIKPENILFSRTGAKIADFGIARIPDSTITRVNTVLGTPAYTSPEALAKGEFGPASDQFAFAATLYEAASGARAFGGDDPIVTAGLVSTEPPAPLEARPGDAAVVRALNAALAKGMAKEVQDRFASCVALGEAVARAVERPGDGVALDPLLEAAVAIRFDAGAAEHIEIERTPLGSRLVLERAVRRSTPPISMPPGETPAPRPSFVIRRQTNRWQNITAAIALAVIVGLILIGRRSNEGSATQDVARPDAASARPTATAKRLAPPAVIAAHATPSSPGAASDAGAAGPDGAATGGPEGGDR